MDRIPKPNTQALSWFYGEYEKRNLRLTPKYQRNPIWSIGQKCFLIDSLISQCPIPQVYINVISEGTSPNRRTVYDVVDGQQRLRAILEFMRDDYKLISTTAKSYPVSDAYKPHIGKKYSDLPPHLQDLIWNYPLAVQELRGWDDEEIRALFRRLNYVVEKLNSQELRHSQYFGEFVNAVENLAKLDFWDAISFFSRRDSQRMKDVEFVSELFIIIIDGPQDQQKTLNQFYADFDVEFPRKNVLIRQFKRVLTSIETLADFIAKSRFSKKADFYGLFGAVSEIVIASNKTIDISEAEDDLKKLNDNLEKRPEEMDEDTSKYYSTVIEGPNKLPKRKERIRILKEIIEDGIED